MRVLQLVASEGKRLDGEAVLCYLQAGSELDVFITEPNMQQTSQSGISGYPSSGRVAPEPKKAVLMIELEYFGELPADLPEVVAQRAYDVASGKGVMMRNARLVYSLLPIKEMKA